MDALVTPLSHPLFAYSGTNAAFQRLIDAAPLVDVGINKAAGEYSRRSDRPAPYNLFSATSLLYKHAPAGASPPPPVFQYRPAGRKRWLARRTYDVGDGIRLLRIR